MAKSRWPKVILPKGAERFWRAFECAVAYLHAPVPVALWRDSLTRNFDEDFAAQAIHSAATIKEGANKIRRGDGGAQ